jgi:hypothetical protein
MRDQNQGQTLDIVNRVKFRGLNLGLGFKVGLSI